MNELDPVGYKQAPACLHAAVGTRLHFAIGPVEESPDHVLVAEPFPCRGCKIADEEQNVEWPGKRELCELGKSLPVPKLSVFYNMSLGRVAGDEVGLTHGCFEPWSDEPAVCTVWLYGRLWSQYPWKQHSSS